MSIEKILEAKQKQYDELQRKLSTLSGYNFDISYTLKLTIYEQIKYAKLGLFYLRYDITRKSKIYHDYKV